MFDKNLMHNDDERSHIVYVFQFATTISNLPSSVPQYFVRMCTPDMYNMRTTHTQFSLVRSFRDWLKLPRQLSVRMPLVHAVSRFPSINKLAECDAMLRISFGCEFRAVQRSWYTRRDASPMCTQIRRGNPLFISQVAVCAKVRRSDAFKPKSLHATIPLPVSNENPFPRARHSTWPTDVMANCVCACVCLCAFRSSGTNAMLSPVQANAFAGCANILTLITLPCHENVDYDIGPTLAPDQVTQPHQRRNDIMRSE